MIPSAFWLTTEGKTDSAFGTSQGRPRPCEITGEGRWQTEGRRQPRQGRRTPRAGYEPVGHQPEARCLAGERRADHLGTEWRLSRRHSEIYYMSPSYLFNWSGRRDSNSRPPAPK